MRDHGDWRRTSFLVFRTEAPPSKRLNFQNGKEVGRNGSTRDQLRLVDSRKDKAFAPITTRDGFEALALLFPFDELRPGNRRCAFTPPSLPNVNHPIRFRYRQWSKQYRVDNAEDRRVCADAEREREHGHGGEAGILQQLAEGESQIIHGFLILDLQFAIRATSSFVSQRLDGIDSRSAARGQPTRQ